MSEKPNVDELDLSDAELIQVLKNHGLSRRRLMQVFGVGAVVSALGGTAAGKGSPARIDEIYGATYEASESVPPGLPDHVVQLHAHPGDATHEGFPLPGDENGDGQDDIPEFFFDPVGLHVEPNEVVHFDVHHATHTVTSFHPKYEQLPDRVPTDHAFTSPPIAEDDSWLYRFTTKGVYDIVCLPHFPFGMVMRIVVFDPKKDSLDDATFDDPGSLPSHPIFDVTNPDLVLTDSPLDPANIVSEGEVAWADLSLP